MHIANSEHLPPVFPNGWIPVLESSQLGVNEVVSLRAFAPSSVKVKTWTCQESCGLIIVWFHADGEEPSWVIEWPADVVSGRMHQMARYETLCSGHVQDIAQKVADAAHLNSLHAATCLLSLPEFSSRPRDSWLCRLMQLKWNTTFAVSGVQASVSISIQMSLMGWKPKFAHCRGFVKQVGPALTVVTVQNIFGRFIALVSATPEAPFQTRIVHRSYGTPGLVSWLWCQAAELGISNMPVWRSHPDVCPRLDELAKDKERERERGGGGGGGYGG
ncbi:hypothetical protein HPB50_002922 [Hyalomma asiaticum]|uniref:Uncharacterized protein n=1 Tax=Hyalomma asiaticum TaxID=266040 RepID=A0ACB7TBL1_HYAAI|nr:hypothetical protein HPB50_002922 [Hyalomma asiaticum]